LSEVFEALRQPRAADASDVSLHGRQRLAKFHACHTTGTAMCSALRHRACICLSIRLEGV